MKTNCNSKLSTCILSLFAALFVAGCASTKITDRDELVTGPIARPGIIWVYDFAATATEVPAESMLYNHPDLDPTPQTAAQIAEGKKLGAQIATELVTEIRAMGMPAQQATVATRPQLNDLVIRGYLLSVNEGSALKRVTIGFGSGASELKTAVEGFQMTSHGLRKIGSGDVEAGGSKGPGAALGLATFIATANPAGLIVSSGMKVYGEESGKSTISGRAKSTAKEIGVVLKQRFTDQGWIN